MTLLETNKFTLNEKKTWPAVTAGPQPHLLIFWKKKRLARESEKEATNEPPPGGIRVLRGLLCTFLTRRDDLLLAHGALELHHDISASGHQ